MKPLTLMERINTEGVKDVCVGIVASNMGYADQSKVVKAGEEVFDYIGELTYAQFRNIKKLKAFEKSNVL